MLAEKRDFSAAEAFSHHHGDVVGGLDGEGADRLVDRNRVAAAAARAGQAQTGRRLAGSVAGSCQARVERHVTAFDRLEQHIERHHLGERRRETGFVGLVLEQHLIGARIHDDGGVTILSRSRRGNAQCKERYERRPQLSAFSRIPLPSLTNPAQSRTISGNSRAVCSLQIH